MGKITNKLNNELAILDKELKIALNELKSKNTFKNQVPNLFTASRLVFIPVILYNIILGNLILAGILALIAASTDFFDGYFARKLNAQSEFGRKLDVIIDKMFAILIVIPLAFQYKILFIPFILDIIIAVINLIAQYKELKPESSIFGKLKTFSFDTLIVSAFFLEFAWVEMIFLPLVAVTVTFELFASILYLKQFK